MRSGVHGEWVSLEIYLWERGRHNLLLTWKGNKTVVDIIIIKENPDNCGLIAVLKGQSYLPLIHPGVMERSCYIYLLFNRHIPHPTITESARKNVKKRDKKKK